MVLITALQRDRTLNHWGDINQAFVQSRIAIATPMCGCLRDVGVRQRWESTTEYVAAWIALVYPAVQPANYCVEAGMDYVRFEVV